MCGGKCCKIAEDHFRCPNLGEDNLCKIYKKRYVLHEPYQTTYIIPERGCTFLGVKKTFVCGNIMDRIKNKELSEDILKGCCYAHPELLNE